MKKAFSISYLLLAICCLSLAQNKYLDSLREVLLTTSKPIDRFNVLDNMVLEMTNTVGSSVDSAANMQMLQIAQQLSNDSLLAISYNWIGTYLYTNKGDHASALEYYFKGIPLAERAKDHRRISSLYIDISLVYFDIQNNEEALKNNRKAAENFPIKSSPMYDYMLVQYQSNMAQYFFNVNQLDSLFHYAQALKETNQRMKSLILFRLTEFIFTGSAYAQLGDLKMADAYFAKAKAIFDSIENSTSRFQFFNTYIPFLLANNRIAEAGEQAKELLKLGIQNNNNNIIKLAGARYLRQFFDAQSRIDSAYYYSRMESELNDLISRESKKNRIQSLAFNEQLRGLEEEREKVAYQNQLKLYGSLGGLLALLMIAAILYRNNRQKQKANKVLESTLTNLKSTQAQLIQSEKMASLGELTAGIAHEIQNPLNFVNNFSEVSTELVKEMVDEVDKGNTEEVKAIANDVVQNLEKINHHGKRAADIVKGMLQHSRSSSGIKESTNINALADEYLRLAYHGLRAIDKSFKASMKMDFDEAIGNINIIPQDIGRVILNLITNAFYVVNERQKLLAASPELLANYEPTVSVSTKKEGSKVLISVKDNGSGIPQKILNKIFQPFFTTKPTGQGTGLGLSLSYDIVKAHGGEIKVNTKENEGTEFIVQIPIQ